MSSRSGRYQPDVPADAQASSRAGVPLAAHRKLSWTAALALSSGLKDRKIGADVCGMRRVLDRLVTALCADLADVRIAVTEIVTELDRSYA
jgi:hypothetical protein